MFKRKQKPTSIFNFEPSHKRPIGLADPSTLAGKLIQKLYGCLGGYVILLALLHWLLWSLAPITGGWSLTYGAVVLTVLYKYTRIMDSPIWVIVAAPWYSQRCGKEGALIGLVLPFAIIMLLTEGMLACIYYALYA